MHAAPKTERRNAPAWIADAFVSFVVLSLEQVGDNAIACVDLRFLFLKCDFTTARATRPNVCAGPMDSSSNLHWCRGNGIYANGIGRNDRTPAMATGPVRSE